MRWWVAALGIITLLSDATCIVAVVIGKIRKGKMAEEKSEKSKKERVERFMKEFKERHPEFDPEKFKLTLKEGQKSGCCGEIVWELGHPVAHRFFCDKCGTENVETENGYTDAIGIGGAQ